MPGRQSTPTCDLFEQPAERTRASSLPGLFAARKRSTTHWPKRRRTAPDRSTRWAPAAPAEPESDGPRRRRAARDLQEARAGGYPVSLTSYAGWLIFPSRSACVRSPRLASTKCASPGSVTLGRFLVVRRRRGPGRARGRVGLDGHAVRAPGRHAAAGRRYAEPERGRQRVGRIAAAGPYPGLPAWIWVEAVPRISCVSRVSG